MRLAHVCTAAIACMLLSGATAAPAPAAPPPPKGAPKAPPKAPPKGGAKPPPPKGQPGKGGKPTSGSRSTNSGLPPLTPAGQLALSSSFTTHAYASTRAHLLSLTPSQPYCSLSTRVGRAKDPDPSAKCNPTHCAEEFGAYCPKWDVQEGGMKCRTMRASEYAHNLEVGMQDRRGACWNCGCNKVVVKEGQRGREGVERELRVLSVAEGRHRGLIDFASSFGRG